MADDPNNNDAFRPQDPHIPGVTDNPKRAKEIAKAAKTAAKRTQSSAPSALASPALWIAILGVAAVGAAAWYGVHWWNNQRSLHEAENPPVAAGVTDLKTPTVVATPDLPFGPGVVAQTSDLTETWSSKQFIFRAPQTADNIPAIVIKLPGNIYWGVELREPFGTCRLEYVDDLAKLDAAYHFTADHPMIGDPCSHAVFDLTKFGPGPNGLVRGETVSGAAVRPPVAIQMTVKGKDVIAVKVEE
jgi:hypothetical protein